MSATARPSDSNTLLGGAIDEVLHRPVVHLAAEFGRWVPIAGWMVLSYVGLLFGLGAAALVVLSGGAAGSSVDRWLHCRGWSAIGFYGSVVVSQVGLATLGALLLLGLVTIVAVTRLGLHRDLAAEAAGAGELGFTSSFRQPTWRLGTAILAGLLAPLVLLSGPLGALAMMVLVFHLPTMAIRDVGSVAALRLQARALASDPARYMKLAALSAVITVVGAGVPLGSSLALTFRHRAARHVLDGV